MPPTLINSRVLSLWPPDPWKVVILQTTKPTTLVKVEDTIASGGAECPRHEKSFRSKEALGAQVRVGYRIWQSLERRRGEGVNGRKEVWGGGTEMTRDVDTGGRRL